MSHLLNFDLQLEPGTRISMFNSNFTLSDPKINDTEKQTDETKQCGKQLYFMLQVIITVQWYVKVRFGGDAGFSLCGGQ